MTTDFDLVIAPRKVRETARFVLADVPNPRSPDGKPMVLIGRHAGRTNPAYYNALIKVTHDRDQGDGSKLSLAKMESGDAAHYKLFARHVFTGWEEVLDADLKPIPYTPERGEAFLTMLGSRDRWPEIAGDNGTIDRYFSDADNFRDEPIGSAEDLGKR